MEVQVYTKTDCPFCVQTKQWFKEFNIDIIEHCLDNEEERLSFFQRINHNQEQKHENEQTLPNCNLSRPLLQPRTHAYAYTCICIHMHMH